MIGSAISEIQGLGWLGVDLGGSLGKASPQRKKPSCDRDVSPYGRQRGYKGPSRWRTPSANTFWVEAMVSKGIRGMLNCWRPVTSPIRHLVFMKPGEGFAQVLSNDEKLGEGEYIFLIDIL